MQIDLPDLAATHALGAELAAAVSTGTVIGLDGDLGAGKTELVRGFVRFLSVEAGAEVASPTFALVHEYDCQPRVRHADLYRVEVAEELEAIGADDLFDPRDGVSLIEWSQRFESLLPVDAWRVWIHREGDRRWAEVTKPASQTGHSVR